jgi:beta-glucanase (GH16 family)
MRNARPVRILSAVLVLAIVCGARHLPAAESSAPEITGKLETESGARVLSLWGSPRERGFAHGWLLGEEIFGVAEEGLTYVKKSAGPNIMNRIVPMVTIGFTFSPDEIAEMEGMLEAIGKRFPGRKLDAMGRPFELIDLKLINTYGDWAPLGCSTAAVWGKLTADGKPDVVRNWDFRAFGFILKWTHARAVGASGKKRGWVGVSVPGLIGPLTAMNGEGVFIAIHDVWVRPDAKDFIQGNVPRLVALRRIMEEVPADGAVEKTATLCRSWNTLFGNNFLVATPGSGGLPAGVLEYDTREDLERGVTLRGPESDGGTPLEYLACTNGHRKRGKDSCWRYDALVKACGEKKGSFDLEGLVDLVSRSAVPAAGKPVQVQGAGTLHQVIAFTGERKMRMRFIEGEGKNIRDAKWVEFRADALLSGLPVAGTAGEWKLVWGDEFDKEGRPDPANWDYERGFVRNDELQWYQPENATCKGGMLIIEARRERKTNPGHRPGAKGFAGREMVEVTSTCLITKGKHEFRYGKFEMRARIDTRLGSWPAFWTLGAGRARWPECGEIDIMEYYTGTVLANVCHALAGREMWLTTKKPLSELGGEAWAKEFHVWTMEWDEKRIDLLLDGKLSARFDVSNDEEAGKENAFRKPHSILLNQAIGGTSGGDPSKLEYPVRLEVDCVRVYERAGS